MMLVTLLGAGPGDPDLLTIKGKKALEKCDVLVYDALANKKFLSYTKKGCEIIYVGKIADQHSLPQDKINELLVKKARENGGQIVVRLKGGDPLIFGRGGEEALFLKNAAVPFEIIPGISSAIAVPTYAGIPLTHRGYTSSLTILTGHESPEKTESAINWSALAQSGSTLVFLMGMKNLEAIIRRLTQAGLDPHTPASVIYRGTTPAQKAVFAPVLELPSAVKNANIKNPAIIVIGKVVQLASELTWLQPAPLNDRTIIVTRARSQASGISEKLAELGANVIQFPTIRITPCQDYTAIDKAIENIQGYSWILFTSANGVTHFWNRLKEAKLDSRALAKCKIGVIGSATEEALLERGLCPDIIPEKFVAESLAEAIITKNGGDLRDCRVLVPRAKFARDTLEKELAAKGAIVDVLPVYETIPETEGKDEVEKLINEGKADCVTFSSSSTVNNFLSLIPPAILKRHANTRLAAIGPVTAATLAEYGLRADITPEQYDISSLIQAICEYYQKREA